jgi:hypothetical protein
MGDFKRLRRTKVLLMHYDRRSLKFAQKYLRLIANAKNEEELRSRFDSAARTELGIEDLKLEQSRHDIRRNHVIIEFKDKGLFRGKKKAQSSKKHSNNLVMNI